MRRHLDPANCHASSAHALDCGQYGTRAEPRQAATNGLVNVAARGVGPDHVPNRTTGANVNGSSRRHERVPGDDMEPSAVHADMFTSSSATMMGMKTL